MISSASASNRKRVREVPIVNFLENILELEIKDAKADCEFDKINTAYNEMMSKEFEELTEEEKDRFEAYTRAHFNRHRIKNIMAEEFKNHQQITDEMILMMSTLAKLYAEKLCDMAVDVMKETTPSITINNSNKPPATDTADNSNSNNPSSSSSSGSGVTPVNAKMLLPTHVKEAYRRLHVVNGGGLVGQLPQVHHPFQNHGYPLPTTATMDDLLGYPPEIETAEEEREEASFKEQS